MQLEAHFSNFCSGWGRRKFLELYTTVLPAVFSVSVFCWYQICGAFGIFGRYCCTVSFGGNTFLRIRGTFFLKNSAGIPFFLQKEGEVHKKGAEAPPS